MDVIDTERLHLRPFGAADAAAAHAWFGDDLVMKYTPTGRDPSLATTRERLERYQAHQTRYGFSKWLITDRLSGRLVGDAGLLHLPDQGCIDLGFRLVRSCWGKGLATEAAAGWLSAASGPLQLPRLAAFVHPENRASIRVLQKLGFHDERQDTVIMGMPALVFGWTAPPAA